MNTLSLIQLTLLLLQGALGSVNNSNTELPKEIVEDLQAAIAKLQKYSGTDVTFPQLEELRLTKLW